MLKLTYTENGFRLEHLAQSLEDWVTNRVLLALRSGTGFYLEPSTAAFLLPADLPYLSELEKAAQDEASESITLGLCDDDSVEVVLQGTWLASEPDSDEGIFVTVMSDRTEFFLCKLWEESQVGVSVLND